MQINLCKLPEVKCSAAADEVERLRGPTNAWLWDADRRRIV